MNADGVLYTHRQSGAPLIWLMIPSFLVTAWLLLTLTGDPVARAVLWMMVPLLLFLLVTFWSLTITVTERELRWKLGVGIVRKRVPLSEIEHVEPIRNSPIWGWGIRWTPKGWLYNVHGLDSVLIRLRSGKQFMLGTDQPRELAARIESARNAAASA
jgi:hypothetical protein